MPTNPCVNLLPTQWRDEAKCCPRPTINGPLFPPLNFVYKNLKWNIVAHNMQLLKALWGRQAVLVAMKIKSRSRPNVEDGLIGASSSLEPRISILSGRTATSWYVWGEQNGGTLMLYLTCFENFGERSCQVSLSVGKW